MSDNLGISYCTLCNSDFNLKDGNCILKNCIDLVSGCKTCSVLDKTLCIECKSEFKI